jgi:hypothetical protein
VVVPVVVKEVVGVDDSVVVPVEVTEVVGVVVPVEVGLEVTVDVPVLVGDDVCSSGYSIVRKVKRRKSKTER